MTMAFIGLGSNLDRPWEQLHQAVKELSSLPDSSLVQCSAIYRNPPMGPRNQPHYLNAVVALDTQLRPRSLMAMLLMIEAGHKRRRQEKWGPRTLDLDLLLYGKRALREPGLTVPHPGICNRAFVLVPLADIAPDQEVPGYGKVSVLAAQMNHQELERLSTW